MRKKSKEDTFEFDGVVGVLPEVEDASEFMEPPVVNNFELPTEKKSMIEVAKEVVAGKWGLEIEEQKRNLENAGYVYAYVRAIANSFSK